MPLSIGQRVRLPSTGEVGVVIWTWHSPDINMTDAYVAFFGRDWPAARPEQAPYVLHYAEASLEPLGQ